MDKLDIPSIKLETQFSQAKGELSALTLEQIFIRDEIIDFNDKLRLCIQDEDRAIREQPIMCELIRIEDVRVSEARRIINKKSRTELFSCCGLSYRLGIIEQEILDKR